ncbi:MAG TPA: tyrosine-type recombinase/integrase [Methylomirabilota bacterium]|jgi:integrase|nr:tyrosine-type recombinase/integrase [Methylomirabilota bacterium]
MPHPSLPHHISARTERGRTLYVVRFMDWQGVRRKFPGTDNLKEAIKIRDFRLGQNALRYDFDAERQAVRRLVHGRFFAWADRWLQLHHQKKTHAKDQVSIRRLKAYFGDVYLSTFTPASARAYIQSRQQELTRYGRPPTNASINRELACLRSLLIAAYREGLIEKYRPIPLLPEDNKRQRTASEEEYQRLLAVLDPACIGPVVLMRECGLRLMEALSLRCEQVDTKRSVLDLGETKNRVRRLVPIPPALLEHMTALIDTYRRGPLWRDGGQPLTKNALIYRFKKACKQAGIQDLWRHDLRSTFITAKLREGWDREFLKPITGHKTDSAFNRYGRPTADDLRQVIIGPPMAPKFPSAQPRRQPESEKPE